MNAAGRRIYATEMTGAAPLLRRAREEAGLSRRALALRAGVPTSTVSRIEDDVSDPTLTMLARLVAATGRRLRLDLEAEEPRGRQPRITALADACTLTADGRKVDWTRIRGVLDQIASHPALAGEAIATPPVRTGDAALDALLAGVAEKVADDHGLPRPRWARSVPPAPIAWETPGTPARIRRARDQAPPQLAARNIWLAAGDLWRAGQTSTARAR